MFVYQRLAAILTTVALLAVGVVIGAPASSANTNNTTFQNEFLTLLNAERAALGRAPLAVHPKLVDRSERQVTVDWVNAGGPYHYTSTQLTNMMVADQCSGVFAEVYSAGAQTPANLVASYKGSSYHWQALMDSRNRFLGSFTQGNLNSTRVVQQCEGIAYPSPSNVTLQSFTNTATPKTVGFLAQFPSAFSTVPTNATLTGPMGSTGFTPVGTTSGSAILGFELPRYNGKYTLNMPASSARTAATASTTITGVGTTFSSPPSQTVNMGSPIYLPYTIYPFHERGVAYQFTTNGGQTWSNIINFGSITASATTPDSGYTGTLTAKVTPNATYRTFTGQVGFRATTSDETWSNGGISPTTTVNIQALPVTLTASTSNPKTVVLGNSAPLTFATQNGEGRTWTLTSTSGNNQGVIATGTVPANGTITTSIPTSILTSTGNFTYSFAVDGDHNGNGGASLTGMTVTVTKVPTTMVWGANKTVPYGANWMTGLTTATITQQQGAPATGTWELFYQHNNQWTLYANGTVTPQGELAGVADAITTPPIHNIGTHNMRMVYTPNDGSAYDPLTVNRTITITKKTLTFTVPSTVWKNQQITPGVDFTSTLTLRGTGEERVNVTLQQSTDQKTWTTAPGTTTFNVWSDATLTWSTPRTTTNTTYYRFTVGATETTNPATSTTITITSPPIANPTIVGWVGGTIITNTTQKPVVNLTHPGILQKRTTTGTWTTHATLKAGKQTLTLPAPAVGSRIEYRIYIPARTNINHAATTGARTITNLSPTTVKNPGTITVGVGKTVKPKLTMTNGRNGSLQKYAGDKWVTLQTVKNGTTLTIKAEPRATNVRYRVTVPATSKTAATTVNFTVSTQLNKTTVKTPASKTLTPGKRYVFTASVSRSGGYLQQYKGKKWVNIQKVTNKKKYPITAGKAGTINKYRIHLPATNTHAAATSKTFTVTSKKTAKLTGVKKKTYTVKAKSTKKVKVTRSTTAYLQTYNTKTKKWGTTQTLKKGTSSVKLKAPAKKKATIKYRVIIKTSKTITGKNSPTVTIKAK